MSWEKNSKKKPMIVNNFCFQVNFITPTGPMVTRYTGGLSQLLLVKMSWEKNSREKLLFSKIELIRLDQIRKSSKFSLKYYFYGKF